MRQRLGLSRSSLAPSGFFRVTLMASRLPTISLKSIHIERAYLLPVMVGLLLLIAFLVSNFWLTIGVVDALYIFTVPVTVMAFIKIRNRYERLNGGFSDEAEAA